MFVIMEWESRQDGEYLVSGGFDLAWLKDGSATITGALGTVYSQPVGADPEATKLVIEGGFRKFFNKVEILDERENLVLAPVGVGNKKYPWADLEVGQNFIVDGETFKYNSLVSYCFKKSADYKCKFKPAKLENGNYLVTKIS